MGIEKIGGIEGFGARGRGTRFVALSALVAFSWVVGCGGESDDGGSGDDGGTAGTSAGKGGTGGGKGGTAGSTSGSSGTGNGGGGGTAGTSVAGGAGGTSGTAGSAGTTGGSAGEGTGGTSGDAGEGNVGGEAAGGSAGEAGDGNIGEGGTSGTVGEGGTAGAAPEDNTVRGKLVDFYRHPLPGVTIGIGTTEVITNAQGEFVIEDVPPVYDASFVVELANPRKIYGWYFQGLTRRDPTLQVIQGINERTLNTNLRAQDGAPTDTQNLTLAIGSEHGSWQAQGIPANGRDSATCTWAGPATTAATAHGLMWSYDEDTELPTDYNSYITFPFALDDAAATQTINVSVAATEITQGNIGGTVTDIAEVGRTNYGFVRFATGATIDLFEDTAGPGTFSYLVPELPNGSVTFAALDEDWQTREYALAYQAGLSPGTTNLALTIPQTASLTAPPDNDLTLVNDTTEFRFQNRQAGVGAVVVRLENRAFYEAIYLVTQNTTFTVPRILQGGFTLRSGDPHYWQVEAHGTYATVDDMASADGYVDPFRMSFYSPEGPRTGGGTLTATAWRFFTYQP